MVWSNPLPLKLIPTSDSNSFSSLGLGQTGLPLGSHVGAFGTQRRHHCHEGVDLYCDEGTPVRAVESGVVVSIIPFTGPHAGLPWWKDTWAVLVEGESGVVAYGEIIPNPLLVVGETIESRTLVGTVTQVLIQDKGRPMTMLHLELHQKGTKDCPAWETCRPRSLCDPTPYLLLAV